MHMHLQGVRLSPPPELSNTNSIIDSGEIICNLPQHQSNGQRTSCTGGYACEREREGLMWRRTHGHDRGWKCCWPNRWSHYNWTQELRLCQLRAPIARVCGVIVDIRRDASGSGSGRSRGRSGEQAVRRILLTQVHTYLQAMHTCVCAPRTWNSSCCCCYCCSYISSLGARLVVCVCLFLRR